MNKFTLVFCLFISCISALYSQSGCPGCLLGLPDNLPEDTIFLTTAADGEVGASYDSDLSFRLPKTTTPVNATDPDTPPGLNISEITILSVSNLPPGLSWEANQLVFEPQNETDGCVKLCGVPLLPGFYNVDVVISAQVLILNQTTSFSFPVVILPGTRVTEGFAMENNVGCGEVTAQFTNNVPAEGQDGYAYFWDFGNGNMSTLEHPGPQTYSEAGVYEVAYQATIDTFGYLLTEVVVEEVACDDLFNNAPDLRVEVFAPNGDRIFNSNEIQNTQTPASFTLNLFIGPGNYTLRVMDEDSGLEGGDDECGTINFNQFSNGSFNSGSLRASLSIFHPVDTIRSVDTVWVYEQPAPPVIANEQPAALCEGDSLLLFIDNGYTSGLQWYRDSLLLVDVDSSLLYIQDEAEYWVSYTSPDGCTAVSDKISVTFAPRPGSPVFQNFDNLLQVFEPEALPAAFSLQWFLDNEPIPGANDTEYCIEEDGRYLLEVTDELSGCTNFYSRQIAFNPDNAGCLPSATNEVAAISGLHAYPNPFAENIMLEGTASGKQLEFRVWNSFGQLVRQEQLAHSSGVFLHNFSLPGLPSGLYWLEVRSDRGGMERLKVVKQ